MVKTKKIYNRWSAVAVVSIWLIYLFFESTSTRINQWGGFVPEDKLYK